MTEGCEIVGRGYDAGIYSGSKGVGRGYDAGMYSGRGGIRE